jgi:cobalt-precorrin-7 (C5)-methyltransferase
MMPEDIAADLLEAGASGSLTALVLERLTQEDETITRTTLSELAARKTDDDDSPFSDLSVLAVRASG